MAIARLDRTPMLSRCLGWCQHTRKRFRFRQENRGPLERVPQARETVAFESNDGWLGLTVPESGVWRKRRVYR